MAGKANPRMSALDKFQAQMDKSYGQGIFKPAREPEPYMVIPTGSISLDIRLGVGGYVCGRIHELWGPEHAGKTTMGFNAVREALAAFPDRQAAYVDVEHRVDIPWMQAQGVDLDRVWLVKPNNAEDVADIVKDVLRSGLFSIVVVDSVGAMIPQIAKDKDAEKSAMGKSAQAITRMVQIAHSEADLTQTTVLLLNQVRANFGYGPDTTTPGGFALKHSSTTRLFIKRSSEEKAAFKLMIDGEERTVGHLISVKIERNSVAPAYRTVRFPMIYVPTEKYGPIGIDRADEAAVVGEWAGLVIQNGGWYTLTLTGEKVQGWDRVVDLIRVQGLADQIRTEALTILRPDPTQVAKTSEEAWEDPEATSIEAAS